MLRRPPAAYRAALALDADLYHFHDPEFLPWGVRLARAGKRVVYDAHEDVPTQIRSKDWIPAAARASVARAFAPARGRLRRRGSTRSSRRASSRSTACAGTRRASR